MDNCLPDWNTEVGVELPSPVQRKSLGLDNELVELLWQNGEVVLHSQTNRKQSFDPTKSKQVYKHDLLTSRAKFCANFLPEIPSSTPIEANKLPEKCDGEKVFKFGASDVNNISPGEQRLDFARPPPRFGICDTAHQRKNLGGIRKQADLQLSHKNHACSVMTIGSSHCSSNQVVNEVDMTWASSCGIGSRDVSTWTDENYGRKVSPPCESTERETLEQAITSSSGGSGSSFWKTSSQSNDTNRNKRKNRDVEESECQSDRRRDRINEKMRALQELIPHSNKWMWMGSGMATMMLPGMQHYMSRYGMRMGPPMLPAIQNFMRLSRLPFVDQAMSVAPTANQASISHSPVNYQNQMQNAVFPEQYANYMGFHSMSNTSQAMNMFNYGSHSAQQTQALAPPGNGNGNGSTA
ncbi:UNVERIFIED_CONTAM: Transcription factor PHYTOCHROME INTERACTING FACTOR-LIKE 13 [Sesamum calycinum]|uniref:Transcription factor PHYTOCHROME INTERACTING FACTOR-LIKE 13 n=1 Tax=Sesamum calycinum TaxID=2727403 RepID=A0AAW2Q3M7_9LAMI